MHPGLDRNRAKLHLEGPQGYLDAIETLLVLYRT